MNNTQLAIFVFAWAGTYWLLSKYWDRLMLFALLIAFRFEYWRLCRKIRKARKTAEYTIYIEPDHVKYKREKYVTRKENEARLKSMCAASKRERAEAIAEKNGARK